MPSSTRASGLALPRRGSNVKYELAEPAIVDEYILGYDSLDPEAPKNAADRKEPE